MLTQARTSALVPGYMSGFGNSFETEALEGALPIGRNSPQKLNYGLYAEQLSGSPSAPGPPALLALSDPPTVKHSGALQAYRQGPDPNGAGRGTSDAAARPAPLGPIPVPGDAFTF